MQFLFAQNFSDTQNILKRSVEFISKILYEFFREIANYFLLNLRVFEIESRILKIKMMYFLFWLFMPTNALTIDFVLGYLDSFHRIYSLSIPWGINRASSRGPGPGRGLWPRSRASSHWCFVNIMMFEQE